MNGKLKWAARALSLCLLAGLVGMVAFKQNVLARLRVENEALASDREEAQRLAVAADKLAQLRAENAEVKKLQEENRDLPKLRNEARQLRKQSEEAAALKAENERLVAEKVNAPAAQARHFVPMEFAREKLRDRGLGTAMYTLETFFAAMRDGNFGRMKECVTVEGVAVLERVPESELRETTAQHMRDFTGYKVVERSQISADEVILQVQMLSMETVEETHFKRVGGQWRVEMK